MMSSESASKKKLRRYFGLALAGIGIVGGGAWLGFSAGRAQEVASMMPPELIAASAMLSVVMGVGFARSFRGERIKQRRVRGPELESFGAVEKRAKKLRRGERGFVFGGLEVPLWLSSTHMVVLGATGSGKTLTMRLIMQSVLPRIKKGSRSRAVLFDAKQDLMPLLSGMNLDAEVWNLNPLDSRSVGWDIAGDVESAVAAQEVARILVPAERNSSQPFFTDATRDLLSGVMTAFIRRAPGRWSFADVFNAMRSIESIREVLLLTEETRDRTSLLENEITASNIIATVRTKMAPYEPIAASWKRAPKLVTLKDFLRSEAILLLGNEQSSRAAIDAMNRVIFKRLTDLLLAQEEGEGGSTWMFLDEAREAGKLDGLPSLLTNGRSKGVSVCLGFQDIAGMREVYGQNVANELVGQCSIRAVLRLESPDTAEWASKSFGSAELVEHKTSRSTDISFFKGGGSVSDALDMRVRECVLPGEFLSLPPTSPEHGLTGFYSIPGIGKYRCTLHWSWIAAQLWETSGSVRGFERIQDELIVRKWVRSDYERLGLHGGADFEAFVEEPAGRVSELDRVVF